MAQYIGYRNNTRDILRQINNLQFTNPPQVLARYATNLLLGNGIEFKASEKIHKIWHEFANRNRVLELMNTTERMVSINGWAIITINLDEKGRAYWNIANPDFTNVVGTNLVEEEIAVIYERFIIDNHQFICKSEYTKNEIKRTLWRGNEDKTTGNISFDENISVNEFNEQVKPENRIVPYIKHNWGFCPVFCIYNYPYRANRLFYMNQTGGNNLFSSTMNQYNTDNGPQALADWSNASLLPEIINNLYRTLYKEMVMGKTRIITSGMTQSVMNRNITSEGNCEWDAIGSDYIINVGQMGAESKVVQNKNLLPDLQMAISNAWNDFFNRCHYSIKGTGTAQKTASESFGEFYNSIETTNQKRKYHGEQWKRGLIKTFKVMGINLEEEDDWSFEIKKNFGLDEASLRDNLIKEIQAGTKTPIDMIVATQGVDYDQAEHIWEKNKEWFTKNNFPIAMEQGGMVSGVNGATSPKGGRPITKSEEQTNSNSK